MFGGYKTYWDSKEKLEQKRRRTRGKLSYQDSSDKIISIKSHDSSTGITTSHDMRLAVVSPTTSYMPTKKDVAIYEYLYSIGVMSRALSQLNGIIAVDIETKGTQAASSECEIVGIGIADSRNIFYIDFATNGKEVNQFVLNFLAEYDQGMVGHNVFFDSAFLQRDSGRWLKWTHDTYGLYKQLATEGYPGQKWGLKDAQIHLLNWDSKGDVELDKWLVKNNHIADVKKEEKPGYVHVENYEDKGERWCKPRKSEMWRAPAQILGFYCGLDAASTWQLLHEVFLPSINNQPWADSFNSYHEMFIENVRLMVAQQLSGITIDSDMLKSHHAYLHTSIDSHLNEFLNHHEVRPFATEYNNKIISELKEKEPIKYKKKKKVGKEPARYKKDGGESLAWKNWYIRKQEIENTEPELTSHWKAWEAKLREAEKTDHLNPSSSAQMQWLFYEKLGNEVLIYTDNGTPSTGAKALPGFGEVGQLLKKQKDDVKEEGYVKACLEHLINGRLHPQFRMPGTLTCRLAGSGGLNLQQIPKSRKYLECWKPAPGRAWIDCDHTSLEQVVLAELSRDASLWKIYGPGARENDIYLFNGSQLPVIGDKIRESGYDPDNPTPDSIQRTKKSCKKERGISKVITLGSSYGMGWNKLQLTLKLQGINVSANEAKEMVRSYWNIYSGVKDYEKFLLEEYKRNNGWVLNGIGRPVAVANDYLKDIVNRVVQSTGHDIHMQYIIICEQLLSEAGIKVDGIVWDFHDQSIVECAEEDKDKVYEIIGRKAYQVLNEEYLKGEIKLKGDPQHIKTMADAKCGD